MIFKKEKYNIFKEDMNSNDKVFYNIFSEVCRMSIDRNYSEEFRQNMKKFIDDVNKYCPQFSI